MPARNQPDARTETFGQTTSGASGDCEQEPITIRPAHSGDIGGLSGLVRAYWQFEGIAGFDTRTVVRLLREVLDLPHRGSIVVADRTGTLVGYFLVVYVFSLEHKGMTAEIDELFVSESCRGAGVGRQLLAFAERTALDSGCTVAALRLGRSNEAGNKFYVRAGYTPRSEFGLLEKRLA